MLYKVTGTCLKETWHEKYCECCDSYLGEEEIIEEITINTVIDAPYPENAIAQIDAKEWTSEPQVIPLPTDQIMTMIGAPRLL